MKEIQKTKQFKSKKIKNLVQILRRCRSFEEIDAEFQKAKIRLLKKRIEILRFAQNVTETIVNKEAQKMNPQEVYQFEADLLLHGDWSFFMSEEEIQEHERQNS